MKLYLLIFSYILLLSPEGGNFTPHIDISDPSFQLKNITKNMQYYVDEKEELTYDDIIKHPEKFRQFELSLYENFFLKGRLWYKFELTNTTREAQKFYVDCRATAPEYVDFYYFDRDKLVEYHTGDLLAFDSRPVYHRTFVFPLNANPGLNSYYISIKTSKDVLFPIFLVKDDKFKTIADQTAVLVLVLGILTFFLIYIGFMAYQMANRLAICLFLIMACILYLCSQITGFTFQYLFPNAPELDNLSLHIVVIISSFFSLEVFYNFKTIDSRERIIFSLFPKNKVHSLFKRLVRFGQFLFLIIVILVFAKGINEYKILIDLFNVTKNVVVLLFIIPLYFSEKEYRYIISGCIICFFCMWLDIPFILWSIISDNNNLYLIRIGLYTIGFIMGLIGIMVFRAQYVKRRILAEEKLHRILIKKDDIETEFINDLVHELGTPVNIIMDNVDELKEELYSGPASSRDKLDIISMNGERISGLVENFIDNAQADAGNFKLNFSKENIRSLINKTLRLYKYQLAELNHRIVYEETNVPEPFIMAVDKSGIEHILSNLIRNSIKYTPEDGTIIIHLRCDDSNIYLSIADNGYGIEDPSNDIFKPYYRKDRLGVASCGMGLGLSITKKWVEAHKGTISFSSPLPYSYRGEMPLDTIRKGTEFIIALPINIRKTENL